MEINYSHCLLSYQFLNFTLVLRTNNEIILANIYHNTLKFVSLQEHTCNTKLSRQWETPKRSFNRKYREVHGVLNPATHIMTHVK